MSKKINTDVMYADRRILNRKVLSGEISEKELQTMFKKLPDVSENAEEVTVPCGEK